MSYKYHGISSVNIFPIIKVLHISKIQTVIPLPAWNKHINEYLRPYRQELKTNVFVSIINVFRIGFEMHFAP